MRPLILGDSPSDYVAALLLASSRQVAVPAAVGSPRGRLLTRAGFHPMVDGMHCLHHADGDRAHLPRKLRQSLTRSKSVWLREGLHLNLTTPGDYGIERLVEEFYHPILVRHLYVHGRSPFGTHNLRQFLALLGGRSVLAVVERGKDTVGAAVLHERSLADLAGPSGAADDLHMALVGMVHGLAPDLYPASRAFLEILRQATGYAGWRYLSMGEDTGWIDQGYLPVVNDKLRWCDTVGFRVTGAPLHLKLVPPRPRSSDDLNGAVLTWDPRSRRPDVRQQGVPDDVIKPLRDHLLRLTAVSLETR